jgi:D-3-phosphoglycerate dehydrogenase
MDKFRLALSSDFVRPDGTPAFPSFDLSPLDDDPRIDWAYVPVRDGRIDAADMAGFDALILLAGRFDAESFPDDGRLALVARFGVGYDNVDVPACSANDVALVITPSGVRRPVAVAIMTFVLALSGKLLIKDRLTRAGPDGWARRGAHMGTGLVGGTLGSIGVGNIGAELFRMAAPVGMSFVAHDPFADAAVARELGIELVPLDEVFRRADFVCVNCPLTDETRGLVNAERLALMKPTACLINTARGPIVDQAALTEALQSGRIAGAGLDVFEDEPSDAADPLFGLENVIVTPHSLCWTDQCFADIGAADVRAVQALVEGKVPEGIVNRDITSNDRWRAKLETYRVRL